MAETSLCVQVVTASLRNNTIEQWVEICKKGQMKKFLAHYPRDPVECTIVCERLLDAFDKLPTKFNKEEVFCILAYLARLYRIVAYSNTDHITVSTSSRDCFGADPAEELNEAIESCSMQKVVHVLDVFCVPTHWFEFRVSIREFARTNKELRELLLQQFLPSMYTTNVGRLYHELCLLVDIDKNIPSSSVVYTLLKVAYNVKIPVFCTYKDVEFVLKIITRLIACLDA